MGHPNNDSKLMLLVIEQLNKYMGKLNITSYKLSQLSGVPYDTIKSIIQHKTNNISLKTIIMLSYGLGISPSEFLDDEKFNSDFLGFN